MLISKVVHVVSVLGTHGTNAVPNIATECQCHLRKWGVMQADCTLKFTVYYQVMSMDVNFGMIYSAVPFTRREKSFPGIYYSLLAELYNLYPKWNIQPLKK